MVSQELLRAEQTIQAQEQKFAETKSTIQRQDPRVKQTRQQLQKATPTSQLEVRKVEAKRKAEKLAQLKSLEQQRQSFQAQAAPVKETIADAKAYDSAYRHYQKGMLGLAIGFNALEDRELYWGRKILKFHEYAKQQAFEVPGGFEAYTEATAGGATPDVALYQATQAAKNFVPLNISMGAYEDIQQRIAAGDEHSAELTQILRRSQAVNLKDPSQVITNLSPNLPETYSSQELAPVTLSGKQWREENMNPVVRTARDLALIPSRVIQGGINKIPAPIKKNVGDIIEFGGSMIGVGGFVWERPLTVSDVYDVTKKAKSNEGIFKIPVLPDMIYAFQKSKIAEEKSKERSKLNVKIEKEQDIYEKAKTKYEAGEISWEKFEPMQNKYLSEFKKYQSNPAFEGGRIASIKEAAFYGDTASKKEQSVIALGEVGLRYAPFVISPLTTGALYVGSSSVSLARADTKKEQLRAGIGIGVGALAIGGPLIGKGLRGVAAAEVKYGISIGGRAGGIAQSLITMPTKAKIGLSLAAGGALGGYESYKAYKQYPNKPVYAITKGVGTFGFIGGLGTYSALKQHYNIGKINVKERVGIQERFVTGKGKLTPLGKQLVAQTKAGAGPGSRTLSVGLKRTVTQKGWFGTKTIWESSKAGSYSPRYTAKVKNLLIKQGYGPRVSVKILKEYRKPVVLEYAKGNIQGYGTFSGKIEKSLSKTQARAYNEVIKISKDYKSIMNLKESSSQVNIYNLKPTAVNKNFGNTIWFKRKYAPFGTRGLSPLPLKSTSVLEFVSKQGGKVYRVSTNIGKPKEITIAFENIKGNKFVGRQFTVRQTTKKGFMKGDILERSYNIKAQGKGEFQYFNKKGQFEPKYYETRTVETTFRPGRESVYVPRTKDGMKQIQSYLEKGKGVVSYRTPGQTIVGRETIVYDLKLVGVKGQQVEFGITRNNIGAKLKSGKVTFEFSKTGSQRLVGEGTSLPKFDFKVKGGKPMKPFAPYVSSTKIKFSGPRAGPDSGKAVYFKNAFGNRQGQIQLYDEQYILYPPGSKFQNQLKVLRPGPMVKVGIKTQQISQIKIPQANVLTQSLLQVSTLGLATQVMGPVAITQTAQLSQVKVLQKPLQTPTPGIITAQTPSVGLITGSRSATKQTPVQAPATTTTPIPIVPTATLAGNFASSPKKAKVVAVQGYSLSVRRGGVFKKVQGVFSRGEAIERGTRRAKGTLAATFKIEKVQKSARKVLKPGNAPSLREFRDYKIVKGKKVKLRDTWIQRRKQRLVSRGEKAEFKSARKSKRRSIKII